MATKLRRLIAERLTADQFGHSPWLDAFDRIAWSVRVQPVSKKSSVQEPQLHLYYKELQNMGVVKVYTINLLRHWASLIPQGTSPEDPIRKIAGENTGLAISVDPQYINKVILQEIASEKDQYGLSSDYHIYRENKKRKIEENPTCQNTVVEFSSPNIAKPFHAGHLRSTILGNFISNISKGLGHKVTRINYLGDWGTQFGLLGCGFKKYGNVKLLENDPIQHLFDIYVKVNKDSKDENGRPTTVYNEGLEYFQRLEKGDEECLEFWRTCRKQSIREYEQLYKRLGVTFDEYHGESMYSQMSADLVSALKEQGLLHIDRNTGIGSVKVEQLSNGEDYYASVVKSDGTSLYLTRDIAAILDRYEKYKFDKMLYVVEKGQSRHFEALVGILKTLGHQWADRPYQDFHVQFGRVQGMSSRRGNVVLLKDILDEAKSKMAEAMKNTDTTKVNGATEIEKVADALGMSAIIVQDLKERRTKNYKFSWERMLQFNGDSGVFLQYAHARLCSLERNCGIELAIDCDISLLQEDSVCILIQHLARFDEILHLSYQELEPYHLTHYLFLLCRLSNVAMRELRVKGEANDIAQPRLLVFHCSRIVLATGLKLLGVVPLEEM